VGLATAGGLQWLGGDSSWGAGYGGDVGRVGVRYGALAVESGGAGPKEGPLEV
jgi:hypothetical protein